MDALFLDIDGVLNGHEKLPSGYCGIRHDKAVHLNAILDAVPTLQLVISSAWRYMTFRGDMTLKGFEYLLLVHGVKCHERVFGVTDPDGIITDEPCHFDAEAWRQAGLRWRREQIESFVSRRRVKRYVVLDDLPLGLPTDVFIQTEGTVGLTAELAQQAIAKFREPAVEGERGE